jgi:tetratricopeptide (TPR) repeat protein
MGKTFSIYLFAIMMMWTAGVHAAGNPAWESGNKAYQAKQYEIALQDYESLVQSGVASADLYYNTANAAYRLNDLGKARLYYEKALRLNPGHKAAHDNLQLTLHRLPNQPQALPEIFFMRWWNGWTSLASANVWAMLLLVCFWALVAFFYAQRTGKVQGKTAFTGRLVLIPLTLILAGTALSCFAAARQVQAVVTADNATLRSTAAGGEKSVAEGAKVTVIQRLNDSVQVRLEDGETGWVKNAAIQVI